MQHTVDSLQAAMAALEAQRALLGDAVVDTALAARPRWQWRVARRR